MMVGNHKASKKWNKIEINTISTLCYVMDTVVYAERLKEFDEDVKWLHSNYNDLIDKFDKEFVSIKKQKVIEHDNDVSKLKEKLKQKAAPNGRI
jgi:hypothetical protein